MKELEKRLAYKAIDFNIKDTTAKVIVRYVMECELWKQDIISPSNKYLCEKFGWKDNTLRSAIWEAKRSNFITTTGSHKNRTFELNINYLKGKMAEQYQLTLRPKVDFSDILPDNLTDKLTDKLTDNSPDNLTDNSPDNSPDNQNEENPYKLRSNLENQGDNNNNNNTNNKSSNNTYSPVGEKAKSDPNIPIAIDLFKEINITGYKKFFAIPSQRNSIKELLDIYSLDEIKQMIEKVKIYNILPYIKSNDKIYSPTDLQRNWQKVIDKERELKVKPIMEDKGQKFKIY